MRMIVTALAISALFGCASNKWSEKVGSYSLNDAKREYGPADSCEHLDSTDTVCSWTTSIGRNWVDKLILTFDKDGRLVSGKDKRL